MAIWHNLEVGPEEGGGQALASCPVTLADGTTVDVAGDVLHDTGGLTIQAAGRQTELQYTQPGVMNLTVANDSGNYTPGRSAAATPLALGLPVRYRETIGRRTFDLFAGQLNQPEAALGGLPNAAGDTVTVTAIDWVGGQQGNPRTFISNLGEWIVYEGGEKLVGYWPMTEAAKPFLPAVGQDAPTVAYNLFSSSNAPVTGDTYITPASTAMPLGEDARIPTVEGPLDSAGVPAHSYHAGVLWPYRTGPLIGAGEVVTAVVWRAPVMFAGAIQELFHVELLEEPTGDLVMLSLGKNAAGQMYLESPIGSLTGTINASGMKPGVYPIAVRFGFSPAVLEVWIGRTRYTGSLSGSGPTSGRINSADSGAFATQGGFGHLQLYVGAPSDWTFADYLAQIDHAASGMTGGLRWQRTDERLRTLARYAGLTDAQLDYDRGVAYMQRASLAGSTWAAQAQLAVATEQGRLITAGDGTQRFDNRINARYNL